MNRSLLVSFWAVGALLAGCGGGGGSAGSPAPAPAPSPSPSPAPGIDANAAWQNFLKVANTWSVSGIASDSNNYTITLQVQPQQPATFPWDGNIYSTSKSTATVGIGGLGTNQSVSTSFYNATSFAVSGTTSKVNADPTTCSVVTGTSSTPPTSAQVGDTGPLQTYNDYNGCVPATSTQLGTSVTTWSLVADGSINLFCIDTKVNRNNVLDNSESDCFQVANDGTLGTSARIMITQSSGFTLTAKNY